MVTGAGGGLGREIAVALARAGARVALNGRSPARLEETADLVRAVGGQAIVFGCDVTDEKSVRECVEYIERCLGPVDLLVNNAATGGPIDSVWRVDTQAWWRALEVNLRGPFLCAHAVLAAMVARRAGAIVNVVSHAGVYRWPLCSAYASSKCALINLSENMALEAGRYGVSVFALHPGLLTIGMTGSLLDSETGLGSAASRVAEWIRQEIRQGRAVPAQRCTTMLVALASGRYDALSGCYLTVDDDLDALLARASGPDGSNLHRLRIRQ
nr:SDR family oxidoreductase [Paraburkholderia sp. NMBU_R16]